MPEDMHHIAQLEVDRHRAACHEAMQNQFDLLNEDIEEIKDNVKSILDKMQNGSGQGLYIRLDRIERVIAFSTKAIGVVAAVVIGLVVNALWDHLFKGG